MQIVVDDLLTKYELTGKGKLVLLLHGWGDSSIGFRGMQQSLSKKFQVLALDLPGFGGTQLPKKTWGVEQYAQFLRSALDKLKLDQPYAVIGHSNGGAIAIKSIADQSINPKKLVLIASSGIRPKKTFRRATFAAIAKTGKAATVMMPEHYRQSLKKSLYQAAGSDMLVVPGLEETFKKTVRQDVQTDAAKINIPTLLIFSPDDPAIPKNSGTTFERLIANSKLHMIENAGHFVHLDQKERVEKLIGDFL